jgi:exopolysaccharide biosynthesis polyprenyl glycosylphosphotransferase
MRSVEGSEPATELVRRHIEARSRRIAFSPTPAERAAIVAIGDAVGAGLAYVCAAAAFHSVRGLDTYIGWTPAAVFAAAWLAALFMVDGYDIQIPASRVRSLAVVLKGVPFAALLAAAFFFVEPYRVNRPVIALSTMLGGFFVLVIRWTAARLLLHEALAKRAILVAATQETPLLKAALESARYDHRVIGVVGAWPGNGRDLPKIGTTGELAQVAEREKVREIIVADPKSAEAHNAVEASINANLEMVTVLDLVERYQGRVPLEALSSEWFIHLPKNELSRRTYLWTRRLLEVVLVVLLLVPYLVLLPFIALSIKITSPGPVFLRQRRVGFAGREFTIFKLRTMHAGAEAAGHQWSARNDPRITTLGRYLRRSRLDEVPQLLNVLVGEMSLIGPRPERPEFVSDLQARLPFYRARLSVKPGISGWAQVKAGYAASLADTSTKLEYDLYYVKNQSLRLDLQIVLHTVFTVLGLRGR